MIPFNFPSIHDIFAMRIHYQYLTEDLLPGFYRNSSSFSLVQMEGPLAFGTSNPSYLHSKFVLNQHRIIDLPYFNHNSVYIFHWRQFFWKPVHVFHPFLLFALKLTFDILLLLLSIHSKSNLVPLCILCIPIVFQSFKLVTFSSSVSMQHLYLPKTNSKALRCLARMSSWNLQW